ncbi:MAG: hypothetical protein NTZ24_16595 [Deltaproteobacteria bacterium]|nr:hypothetical protein [Deltaproteobacteria bacterium]
MSGETRIPVEWIAGVIALVESEGNIWQVNPAAEWLFMQPAENLAGTALRYPVVSGPFTEVELIRSSDDHAFVKIRAGTLA